MPGPCCPFVGRLGILAPTENNKGQLTAIPMYQSRLPPSAYPSLPSTQHTAFPTLDTARQAMRHSAAAAASYGYQAPSRAAVSATPAMRMGGVHPGMHAPPPPALSAREHGMSPFELQRATLADQAKRAIGVPGLGGGLATLGKAYIPHQGREMLSASQTSIKHTSPALALVDQSHEDMHAYLGAETAGKLDAALSLSGTPAAFHLNDTQHMQAHRAALATQLALEHSSEPDLDLLMSATAGFTATQSMIRNSLRAQASLMATNEAPTRWMWNGPMWRMATPMPTVGAYGAGLGSITPGLEDYMLSITCGADQGPILIEPY